MKREDILEEMTTEETREKILIQIGIEIFMYTERVQVFLRDWDAPSHCNLTGNNIWAKI